MSDQDGAGSGEAARGRGVSPRVLVARNAMTAEARMKMLPASSAR